MSTLEQEEFGIICAVQWYYIFSQILHQVKTPIFTVNFLQKTVFQGNTVKYGEILSHRKTEQQRNRESPSRRMTSASFAQSCLNMTMETGRRAPTRSGFLSFLN